MEFTVGALWAHMGLFAKAVVIYMLLMSVASVFIFSERLLTFTRSQRASQRFAMEMSGRLAQGQDLATLAEGRAADSGGYLGRIMHAGLVAWRTTEHKPSQTVDSVARALERQGQLEVLAMKRGIGILATVASTAPFVGLLGTVMGIVTSFQLMAQAGSGGLGIVSAGIAEALVTTAIGLLVAIPAVMAFNYLQTWIEARAVEIAASSNELLDAIARAAA
jgi:biopolymer transport protein ExbB/TolQ